MNNTILFETDAGNTYCHSRNVNQFLLTHPVLHYLLNLEKQGIDAAQWLEEFEDDSLFIEGRGAFSREDVEYYMQKFLLLSENGYLDHVDIKQRTGGRLTPGAVLNRLANTMQVVFETTDRCNLECEYCGYGKFYTSYDKRVKKDLSFDTAKNLLDHLVKLWNSNLNISHKKEISLSFYGGEPLVNFPLIRRLVEYSQQVKLLHNRFRYSMTTNALLLEKHMDFLVEHDFNILVSLDGNEESNSYRVFPNGQPAYHTILKNVGALKKKHPRYFERNVRFNAVLHNKNSVSGLHRYFKESFDKIPAILELNTSGIAPEMHKVFWKTYKNFGESAAEAENYSELEKEMFTMMPDPRSTSDMLRDYCGYIFNRYTEFSPEPEGRQYIPTGTCLPFARKVYLTVNGRILPCERVAHRFALGHADADNVALDFEHIARQYNDYYDRIAKYCNTCRRAKHCKQCIFYLNIDDESPVCNGYDDYQAHSRYLAGRMSYLEKNPGLYNKLIKEVNVL